jgi:hypothetical protein
MIDGAKMMSAVKKAKLKTDIARDKASEIKVTPLPKIKYLFQKAAK